MFKKVTRAFPYILLLLIFSMAVLLLLHRPLVKEEAFPNPFSVSSRAATSIRDIYQPRFWDDYSGFKVFQNDEFLDHFDSYAEAAAYAKQYSNSSITYRSDNALVWSNLEQMNNEAKIEVPAYYQMPELERGCEVTSLSMLLMHAGVDVDKMTLAEEVDKDPTEFEFKEDGIHYGNPNDGFVGDMYTFDNPGFGVYHDPIAKLAEKYIPNQVFDLTGADFDDVLYQVSRGNPVWVITNERFVPLGEDDFETWNTPDGPIRITYLEHAVVITGYDNDYIYINDPLNDVKQVDRSDFIASWEQMGNQAITTIAAPK